MNDDPFKGEDFGFMDEEAEKAKDWPLELQYLIDNGLVKVEYDEHDEERFYLTELGKEIWQEMDPNLN